MYKYDTGRLYFATLYTCCVYTHIAYYYNIDQAEPEREYKICYTNDEYIVVMLDSI